jgi:hypothetical protein
MPPVQLECGYLEVSSVVYRPLEGISDQRDMTLPLDGPKLGSPISRNRSKTGFMEKRVWAGTT